MDNTQKNKNEANKKNKQESRNPKLNKNECVVSGYLRNHIKTFNIFIPDA